MYNKMQLGAVLYVYQGEWGLPSIDLECLQTLCLVKFTKCPLKIVNKSDLFSFSVSKLPCLEIGSKRFIGYQEIKKLLDMEGYAIDKKLNSPSKDSSHAYVNWVFTNLHPYYHYFMHGDPSNIDTTRALYAKRTPFPFNFYYPGTYRKHANDVISVMAGFNFHDSINNHECEHIIVNAKKCINILSKNLGANVWFFNDDFSELDVTVYAYLSILYNISLPNNPLKNHIQGCTNLLNFINRISRDIFKKEAFDSKTTERISTQKSTKVSEDEYSSKKAELKTKVFAGIGALLAMGIFAVCRGTFNQFSISKRYSDLYDYDEDNIQGME